MQENDTDSEIPNPDAEITCSETGKTFHSMDKFDEHKERLMQDACVEATANRLDDALNVSVETVEEALNEEFSTVVIDAIEAHNAREKGIELDLIDSNKEMVAGAVLEYIGFKMFNKSVCDD